MGFNTKIVLVDIEPVLNTETGKNQLQIVREREVYADRQEVGMDEFYASSSNHITLSATFELSSSSYDGERYILCDNRTKQYEIARVGKGRSPAHIRLPVKAVQSKSFLLEGMTSG